MKLSPFFSDLSASYGYEIEDLTYDSAGDNVLASRLKVKRDQFADLMPMCEFDPVMVAPAFRDGFRFEVKAVFDQLVAAHPDDFPAWEDVAPAAGLEPWASSLAQHALASPGGERFMLIAAGLEYISSVPGAGNQVEAEPARESEERREAGDDDSGDSPDLAEAGEDYLSEQGFDRRS
ncbi:MAG: hypothetical protein ABI630_10240 [Betaproteobacteria bacterium]